MCDFDQRHERRTDVDVVPENVTMTMMCRRDLSMESLLSTYQRLLMMYLRKPRCLVGAALEEKTNPVKTVFNECAESLNYGFVLPVDWKV